MQRAPDSTLSGPEANDATEEISARDQTDPRYIVPGLARGLAVLQLFGPRQAEMKLSELAAGAGLTRSAAYRLVYTLEKEGFLLRDVSARSYRLTSKVMSLGYSFLSTTPLVEVVHPYLSRISEQTGAASHLVGLDGVYAVYLARITPPARLVSNLQVGTRLPAHATISGRVLLAGLDNMALLALHPGLMAADPNLPELTVKELLDRAELDRDRGYVVSDSIFEPNIVGCAAPVRDGTRKTVGALNVLGPKSRLQSLLDDGSLSGIVSGEALKLSLEMGFQG